MKKPNVGKVALLIPANNEEKVIKKTLEAVLSLVPKRDLYVVDDGSIDKTGLVAKKYTSNVLIQSNRGKANALNAGIRYFKLVDKYEYILFMDADSRPRKDFLKYALPHFENDTKGKTTCVSGRIRGIGHNWITKYRQWEYTISFNIHKSAQAQLSSILVTPGCATVYRSSIFKTMQFPSGTLTEDMDFTFQMHRAGFRNMVFEDKAVVHTVDPDNVPDFIKQLTRWYTGFWQVVRKHDIPWGGQTLDLEVAVLATEGLYNGLLIAFLLISIFSLLFYGGLNILFLPLLIDLFLFFIPTLVWSSLSDRDYTRILYVPQFYLLRFISSMVFLISFFKGSLSTEKEYVWNSNRNMGKEVA